MHAARARAFALGYEVVVVTVFIAISFWLTHRAPDNPVPSALNALLFPGNMVALATVGVHWHPEYFNLVSTIVNIVFYGGIPFAVWRWGMVPK